MIRTISHVINTEQGSVLLKASTYVGSNKIKYQYVLHGKAHPISKSSYLHGVDVYKEQNPMPLKGVPAPVLDDEPPF